MEGLSQARFGYPERRYAQSSDPARPAPSRRLRRGRRVRGGNPISGARVVLEHARDRRFLGETDAAGCFLLGLWVHPGVCPPSPLTSPALLSPGERREKATTPPRWRRISWRSGPKVGISSLPRWRRCRCRRGWLWDFRFRQRHLLVETLRGGGLRFLGRPRGGLSLRRTCRGGLGGRGSFSRSFSLFARSGEHEGQGEKDRYDGKHPWSSTGLRHSEPPSGYGP